MREADVVIAGAGLAGSLAAAMLGRAGINAVIVDPHSVYLSQDFRLNSDGARGLIAQVNDGGVQMSTDGTNTWTRTNGLTTFSPINVAVNAVRGKAAAITMGTGEWQYDRSQHALEWRTPRQVWLLKITGNRIEGTLTLADRTVFRKMTLDKNE